MLMLRAASRIAQVKPDMSDSRAANLSAMYLGNKPFLMKGSNDLKSGCLVEMKAPCILARKKGLNSCKGTELNNEVNCKWGAPGRVVHSYLSLPLAIPLFGRHWKRHLWLPEELKANM